MREIADASTESLIPFVQDSVAPGSMIHTDGWLGYLPLEAKGDTHQVRFLRGKKKTPSELLPRVQQVASLLTLEDDLRHHKVFEVAGRIPVRWPPEVCTKQSFDSKSLSAKCRARRAKPRKESHTLLQCSPLHPAHKPGQPHREHTRRSRMKCLKCRSHVQGNSLPDDGTVQFREA